MKSLEIEKRAEENFSEVAGLYSELWQAAKRAKAVLNREVFQTEGTASAKTLT